MGADREMSIEVAHLRDETGLVQQDIATYAVVMGGDFLNLSADVAYRSSGTHTPATFSSMGWIVAGGAMERRSHGIHHQRRSGSDHCYTRIFGLGSRHDSDPLGPAGNRSVERVRFTGVQT